MNKSQNQNVFLTFWQPSDASVSLFGPFYRPFYILQPVNPYPFIYLKPESGTLFGRSLSVWAILESTPQDLAWFYTYMQMLFLSTNSLRYEIIFYSPEALFCFSHFTYLLSRALLSVRKERSDTRNYVYVNQRAVPKIIYFLQRMTS